MLYMHVIDYPDIDISLWKLFSYIHVKWKTKNTTLSERLQNLIESIIYFSLNPIHIRS
jgi:hypothetical protein